MGLSSSRIFNFAKAISKTFLRALTFICNIIIKDTYIYIYHYIIDV